MRPVGRYAVGTEITYEANAPSDANESIILKSDTAVAAASEAPASASLVSPVTRCNVDLVHSVAIPVGFAEERAVLAFEVDPGDVKPEFFGVTAERDGDRVAHRDPGRQADVMIGATGAGHDPTAAFGEHSRAPWYDRVDVISLRGGSRTDRA